jgi:hypothetical protein
MAGLLDRYGSPWYVNGVAKNGRWQFGGRSVGSRRGGSSPRLERFVSEDAGCVAGDEMALDVEVL